MCRSIKTLHNFEPPATHDEIRASSLQFVRKLSGYSRPSKANEAAFNRAVDQVSDAVHELLHALVSQAPPRDRAVEAAKPKSDQQTAFALWGVCPKVQPCAGSIFAAFPSALQFLHKCRWGHSMECTSGQSPRRADRRHARDVGGRRAGTECA